MKEIVIKMSDEDYEFTKGAKTARFFPSEYYVKLILNGTELPKGHGRLIEVTPRLEMYLSTFQSYTGIDEAPYEYADELIRNADTGVEADEGDTE